MTPGTIKQFAMLNSFGKKKRVNKGSKITKPANIHSLPMLLSIVFIDAVLSLKFNLSLSSGQS